MRKYFTFEREQPIAFCDTEVKDAHAKKRKKNFLGFYIYIYMCQLFPSLLSLFFYLSLSLSLSLRFKVVLILSFRSIDSLRRPLKHRVLVTIQFFYMQSLCLATLLSWKIKGYRINQCLMVSGILKFIAIECSKTPWYSISSLHTYFYSLFLQIILKIKSRSEETSVINNRKSAALSKLFTIITHYIIFISMLII